jgi:choline dehydrogenase-like flavoprotein
VIIRGRDHRGDLSLEAEVVVVGSGAGGAVVAKELAEAGIEVLVLEEGGHTPPEVYAKYRPSETLRHVARAGGSSVAVGLGDTPLISLLMGRTVGGSSVMTGGVCFRIPGHVIDHWVKELKLETFSERHLEEAYRSVEREVQVAEVPADMRSRSTALLVEGATARGVEMKPLRRNTSGCLGAARCNFGCPHHAKLSVDVTYLRKAEAHGMRLYADCLVEKVIARGGKAAGVEGRLLNGPDGTPGGRLSVRAKTVVVSAGTLHTPKILSRSGIARRSRSLGRHITLHPAFRVVAVFDTLVEGWKGAMQSVYSDALEEEGLTLVGIWVPVSVLAAATPGVGPAHQALMRKVPNMAVFGGMVPAEGGGRVWNVPGREPLITYRMHARDRKRMFQGIRVLAECFFAAGAREVMVPVFGMAPLKNPDGLRILDGGVPASRVESAAFHPLGSARVGPDGRSACISPTGEAFDLEGLYVADGSLFPTSIGVNSQLPIMTVATKVAWGLRDKLLKARPSA